LPGQTDTRFSTPCKFLIQRRDLEKPLEIGKGTFTAVVKAEWRARDVVSKHIALDNINKKRIEDFVLQLNFLVKLRPHPNLAEVLGLICEVPVALVTEYWEGQTLNEWIQKTENPKRDIVYKFMTEISRGLLHLHLETIVHQDIRSKNIIKTVDDTIKITDFGFGLINKIEDQKVSVAHGDLKFMAPEILSKSAYTYKSDTYSFGITLLEFLTKANPFPGESGSQIATKKENGTLKIEIPSTSGWIKQLITECTSTDPKARPNFIKISQTFDTNVAETLKTYAMTLNSTEEYQNWPSFLEYSTKENEMVPLNV